MKVLVIGSGAREHAIAYSIAKSENVKLFAAPGNPGMKEIAECIDIKVDDSRGLLEFALKEKIDLTIVGPELPLVMGIVDLFRQNNLKIFGPDKKAAQLEGSKSFAKEFMNKYHIPTANYKEYTEFTKANRGLEEFSYPLVIKADGLAAGKGVIIAQDKKEAEEALYMMMEEKAFGDSGSKIILEEFLDGIEASILCFIDNNTIVPMESAQDYKKAFDGDLGLNTGGMGSYSPNRIINDKVSDYIKTHILDNFLKGVKQEQMDYRGIIYVGLMIKNDEAKVIEFNCRLGDPETQVILPRLDSKLLDICFNVVDEKLDKNKIAWKKEKAVGVVLASGGYPVAYEKGFEIKGLDAVEEAIVFHAGTKEEDRKLITNGGRVLTVVSLSDTIESAREKVYKEVEKISFEKSFYRKDIAK